MILAKTLRGRPFAVLEIALALLSSANGAEETVRYKPVPREIVESRLKR